MAIPDDVCGQRVGAAYTVQRGAGSIRLRLAACETDPRFAAPREDTQGSPEAGWSETTSGPLVGQAIAPDRQRLSGRPRTVVMSTTSRFPVARLSPKPSRIAPSRTSTTLARSGSRTPTPPSLLPAREGPTKDQQLVGIRAGRVSGPRSASAARQPYTPHPLSTGCRPDSC